MPPESTILSRPSAPALALGCANPLLGAVWLYFLNVSLKAYGHMMEYNRPQFSYVGVVLNIVIRIDLISSIYGFAFSKSLANKEAVALSTSNLLPHIDVLL